MKNLKLVVFILFFGGAAIAQTEDNEGTEKQAVVPLDVKTAFQRDYPGIKEVSWDEEDADYEAEFKKDGVEVSVLYDKNGHKKSIETGITTTLLPHAVMDYYRKNYAGYELTEAAKIVTDKNVTTYEIEVGKDGKSRDLIFDSNGKFLKQEDQD